MGRGFLFSTDALLASMILIGGLILISSIVQHKSDTSQLASASEDILASLNTANMAESQDSWIVQGVSNGTMEMNSSYLEEIGLLWATGRTSDAQRLAQLYLGNQYPGYGVKLTIEGTTLFERNTTKDGRNILLSTRMISGIAQGRAVAGSSAVAYLRRIKDKRTASFTTFGGFVGQGNITVSFLDLPSDANITEIYLELAPGAPFMVSFNNITCGGTRTAPTYNGTPTSWDLTNCSTSLIRGSTNYVSVNFSSLLNISYIAGGVMKVKYKTSQFAPSYNTTFVQYRFPGIDGIVNLYDSFYVPGTLLNMSVYLHYNSSNSTFFDVGEKRVWEDTPNDTEIVVILNDSYLQDPNHGRLDYNFLSNKTVPIRVSGFNYNETVVTSGDADVVLITDFTGSMKKAVNDWSQGNLGSNCAGAYTDSTVRRTLLAQCLDQELVGTIMNYSGNRIWPIMIYDDRIEWYNNPTSGSAINGFINSYPNGKGKTCIACALNLAYNIFTNFSNSSRKKFIVLMSDGAPTHCASGSCVSTSQNYGVLQCQGMCDTNGACDASNIPAQCTECTSNQGGYTNAYFSANRTRVTHNATIFTIGFGPVDDCSYANSTLRNIASLGNGTYQHSNDSANLRLIYSNITQEILTRTALTSQLYATVGSQARSRLFRDSYINITYELANQYLPTQNEIAISLQTAQACHPVLPLYSAQRLVDVKAISYSGVHWSDFLSINGTETYNLSTYFVPYDQIGDPTVIHAPISLFSVGNNILNLETGDGPQNRSGCSVNNSAIYTVSINLSTERSSVVEGSSGCVWRVAFVDNTTSNLTIPSSYSGSNACSYRPGNITYNASDAYQLGAYTLFERLDFTKEGTLFVNLEAEDLEVIVTTIGGVPYMWGPVTVKLEVTR